MNPISVYLRDLVTNELFTFQFNPQNVSTRVASNWATHEPHGSSFPIQHFVHSKGRATTFPPIIFVRRTDDSSDIEDWVKRFESFPLADYDTDGRLLRGPHAFRFVWGAAFARRVLITDIEIDRGPGFDPETLNAWGLSVKITMVEVPETGGLSREQIRQGS